MSTSAEQLAARLESSGNRIVGATRTGVEKSCFAGKSVMTAALRSAAPSGRVSGVGTKGARVSVGYKVTGGTKAPLGILSYRGPVHLLNNDAVAHEIEARRKKALRTPFGTFARVEHPGHAGKQFHQKAEPTVLGQSKRIIVAEVRGEYGRAFVG